MTISVQMAPRIRMVTSVVRPASTGTSPSQGQPFMTNLSRGDEMDAARAQERDTRLEGPFRREWAASGDDRREGPENGQPLDDSAR